jgi:hypothetical protein
MEEPQSITIHYFTYLIFFIFKIYYFSKIKNKTFPKLKNKKFWVYVDMMIIWMGDLYSL